VSTSKGPFIRIQKNHPQELIIGNQNQGITTRRSNEVISNSCFVSKVEPNNVKEAHTDELWIATSLCLFWEFMLILNIIKLCMFPADVLVNVGTCLCDF